MSGRALVGISVLAAASALVLAWRMPGREGIPVTTAPVRKGLVEETVSATRAGTLRCRVRVLLGAQAAGRVASLRHRELARVPKGELLCALEDAEQRARLLQSGHTRAAAEGEVRRAEAALADAERHRERLRWLLDSKAVSEDEMDQAETRASLEGAVLEAVRARALEAAAAEDVARAQLDKAGVHAPFDGLVSETFVEAGQWVVPGTPVCEFLDDAALHVEADIDEIDSARLREGQPVHLTVDAIPGERFAGVLGTLFPAVSTEQEKNRTVRVKVPWTAPRQRIRPGMSVGVEVVVDAAKDALYVPSPAIMDRGGRRSVYVAAHGRAVLREIAVGIGNWETTQVTSGLEEGELVILSLAAEGLRNGARVLPAGAREAE